MHRTPLAISLAIAMFASSAARADDGIALQYLIKVKYCEQIGPAEGACGSVKVLAAPTLATVAGRPSQYLVGGEKSFGDENIEFGTALKIRLARVDSGAVEIVGTLETSEIADSEQDVVTRKSEAVHFKRKVQLGETTRLKVPRLSGNSRTLELSIEKVTALPPAGSSTASANAAIPR